VSKDLQNKLIVISVTTHLHAIFLIMKPLIVPLGTYKTNKRAKGNREQQKSRYAHSETDQTRPTHSLSEWSDEVSSQTGIGQVTGSHVAGAVAT
jgi:hypothetical protein